MSQITDHFEMNTQSEVTMTLMKIAHKTYSNTRQSNMSTFTLDWLSTSQLHGDVPLFGKLT